MKYFNKILAAIIFCALIITSCTSSSKKSGDSPSSPNDSIVEVSQNDSAKMETYVNSVYRYHIDYPAGLLIPQGESDSGDGQIFSDKENSTNELRVYRDVRDMIENGSALDKAYEEDINDNSLKITNKWLSEDFYTIEGKSGNNYIYQKTIFRKDKTLVTAILTFQEKDKNKYEKLISPIFDSMK